MLQGKKVYICSPLSAETQEGRMHNMEMAKFYLVTIQRGYHCRSFASHAHLPMMLDDSIPEERETALRIGREMMKLCDALVICGQRISSGMKGEIQEAFRMKMEVFWYDSSKKPLELIRMNSWKEISDEVQIQS